MPEFSLDLLIGVAHQFRAAVPGQFRGAGVARVAAPAPPGALECAGCKRVHRRIRRAVPPAAVLPARLRSGCRGPASVRDRSSRGRSFSAGCSTTRWAACYWSSCSTSSPTPGSPCLRPLLPTMSSPSGCSMGCWWWSLSSSLSCAAGRRLSRKPGVGTARHRGAAAPASRGGVRAAQGFRYASVRAVHAPREW